MSNKTVVLTGASSGIGAALAAQLGQAGCHLILAARREKELQEITRACGSRAIAVTTDVTRRREVERLLECALDEFKQVDVWINNAGQGINRPVLELTDQDFDAMMAVNVKSALYGMQVVAPYFMKQGKGHLINVSSLLSRVPVVSFRSAYSAAKAALNTLTTNLRMDLRQDYPDIHVSLVMPGAVSTDFSRNAVGGAPAGTFSGSAMKPQTAEEVAAMIAALIEQPKDELYTNPASPVLMEKYCEAIKPV